MDKKIKQKLMRFISIILVVVILLPTAEVGIICLH